MNPERLDRDKRGPDDFQETLAIEVYESLDPLIGPNPLCLCYRPRTMYECGYTGLVHPDRWDCVRAGIHERVAS